jgi:hypothetical protein
MNTQHPSDLQGPLFVIVTATSAASWPATAAVSELSRGRYCRSAADANELAGHGDVVMSVTIDAVPAPKLAVVR